MFGLACSFLPPIYFVSSNLLCSKLQTTFIQLMLPSELSFLREDFYWVKYNYIVDMLHIIYLSL